MTEFRLTRASNLPFPTRAREVRGEIRFGAAPPPPLPQDAPAWRWVHPGDLAVDFRPLGFGVHGREALGWYASPDSVRIILDPTVDHGHVEIVGSASGAGLDGRWELISDFARAGGEVTLRRLLPR
jgi:hypothetical protein